MKNLGMSNMDSQLLLCVARESEQVMNVMRRGHFGDLERTFVPNKGPAYCSLNFCDGTQVLKTTTP